MLFLGALGSCSFKCYTIIKCLANSMINMKNGIQFFAPQSTPYNKQSSLPGDHLYPDHVCGDRPFSHHEGYQHVTTDEICCSDKIYLLRHSEFYPFTLHCFSFSLTASLYWKSQKLGNEWWQIVMTTYFVTQIATGM